METQLLFNEHERYVNHIQTSVWFRCVRTCQRDSLNNYITVIVCGVHIYIAHNNKACQSKTVFFHLSEQQCMMGTELHP